MWYDVPFQHLLRSFTAWQAEIERLELALTSKLSADVWVLVTAFLARPRGLIDEVENAMEE